MLTIITLAPKWSARPYYSVYKCLRQKPATLYLSVPENELLALAPVIKLCISALMTSLIRAYDQNPKQQKVPLIWGLDEAGTSPIPGLPHYLSTIAGRNMSAMLLCTRFKPA